MNSGPRIILAAGGTGGHMFPAEALSREMACERFAAESPRLIPGIGPKLRTELLTKFGGPEAVDGLRHYRVSLSPIPEPDAVVDELEGVFGEGGSTPIAGMFRFMPLEGAKTLAAYMKDFAAKNG